MKNDEKNLKSVSKMASNLKMLYAKEQMVLINGYIRN